jgi:hypothetical protein
VRDSERNWTRWGAQSNCTQSNSDGSRILFKHLRGSAKHISYRGRRTSAAIFARANTRRKGEVKNGGTGPRINTREITTSNNNWNHSSPAPGGSDAEAEATTMPPPTFPTLCETFILASFARSFKPLSGISQTKLAQKTQSAFVNKKAVAVTYTCRGY